MPSAALNLSAIDEAFGEKADLYRDVLRIKSDVSTDQVQQAYFNRRDELFQILAKMDQSGVAHDSPKRYQVERQMDAVVMSLRVLGDPDARLRYDAIRRDRVVGRKISASYSRSLTTSADEELPPLGTSTSISYSDKSSVNSPNSPRRRRLKSALKKTKSLDESYERSVTISQTESIEYIDPTDDGDDYMYQAPQLSTSSKEEVVSRASKSSKSRKSHGSKQSPKGNGPKVSRVSTKRKTRKVTPTREELRESKNHKVIDDDASQISHGTTLSVLESKRTIFEVVKDEIVGVFEDTSKSVEQVFNAFTLQDDEIEAVFGRIDKAKQQMADEFTA
ncbi:hypothetical protein ACA910_006940 [Epithemia clementina (nom. ined.)]